MIAFVFPGQGSQYIGMGKDVATLAEDLFDEASRIVGFDIYKLCVEGHKEELNRTENTQPAIVTVSYALLREVLNSGIKPSYVSGHSLGEYTAGLVAEVFTFSDTIKITRQRGILMTEAKQGKMAAILGLDDESVKQICKTIRENNKGYIDVANFNCPGQVVVSGETDAVKQACELAKQKNAKKVVILEVSIPSHCLLMKEASQKFKDFISQFKFDDAKIPIITNVDAKEKKSGHEIMEALIRQLYSPVYWQECILYMISKGVNTFFEIGPGKVLSGLIKRVAQAEGQDSIRIFNIENLNDLEIVNEILK